MNFFVVMQNKTFKEENEGEFLWAPKTNKDGNKVFHWTNMTNIKKGDIIFSSYEKKLVSINIAQCSYYESENPFLSNEDWEKSGWMIDLKYHLLDEPIFIEKHKEQILRLKADKYSSFNKNGTCNQGYLFELSNDLANYFLEISKSKQNNKQLINLLNKIYNQAENELIANIKDNISKNKTLNKTEKEQIIKIRIGQGKFKRKLLNKNKECAICGLENENFLIGSHIKPWSKSNDEEKLDYFNGLLLCPNHDALFDKGYISFNDNGKIIISDNLELSIKKLMDLNDKIKISLDHRHIKYLTWHRENVFID